MIIKKNILKSIFKYLLLVLLLYMPIFGHLDKLPLRIWDEARLAISAYEMIQNGDLLVVHYDGQPEMWSTKPPLVIWMQVFFMKVIGINVIAIRLPSAITAFFTCLSLVLFSILYLKSFWFGFIASLVLVTSNGYIDMHGTRTGDYDAPLTFFTTLACLLFFLYLEKGTIKYLYLFFFATLLGILTKGIACLLLAPALLVYIIFEKKLKYLLQNKHFYIGIFSLIIVILSYYLLRESKTPGYLNAVWNNELGGRYMETQEGHKHEFLYYYYNLINWQFAEWCLMIPCGFLIGIFTKNENLKKLVVFSTITALIYVIIISLSKTKLHWYTLPAFPFLAIITAAFIYFIFDLINNRLNNVLQKNILPLIFLFLIFVAPYNKIIDKTYLPEELEHEKDFYEIGHYLKDATKGKIDLNGYKVLYHEYNAHVKFYLIMLKQKGIDVSFGNWESLEINDKVIASQDHVKEFLDSNYFYNIIGGRNTVVEYIIKGKK